MWYVPKKMDSVDWLHVTPSKKIDSIDGQAHNEGLGKDPVWSQLQR